MWKSALSLLTLCIHLPVVACTGFYVGRKVSTDGSIILGRTIDHGTIGGSRTVVVPRVENEPGRIYTRTKPGMDDFVWPLPPTTYGYVMTPMGSGFLCGEWSSCCLNEKGLAVTGTVTGYTRRQVRAVFPFSSCGVAEYNYPALVAATCASAREAIELTARVMERLGTAEANIFMVADREEAWLIETYTGHLWAAHRLPDDVAGGFGNHFVLGAYDPDSADWRATPGIGRLLEEKGLAVWEDGRLHLEKSLGGPRSHFANIRSWFARRLMAPGTEGPYAPKRLFDCFYPPFRRLDVRDVEMLTRERYLGTEWDPDVDDRNDVRVIGSETTMSAHVIHVRPDLPPERALTAWVALGPAEHAPFLPLANCTTAFDEAYSRDHADPKECYSRYLPELYASDAFRRLCGLAAQDRECYGNSVRDYWMAREVELLSKWPAIWETGDVAAMTAFTLREQRRAMEDANRMSSEIEHAMTRNARKLVQMQDAGVSTGYRARWIYVPSDVEQPSNGVWHVRSGRNGTALAELRGYAESLSVADCPPAAFESAPAAIGRLAAIEPEDDDERREVVEFARRILDAAAVSARRRTMDLFARWREGNADAERVRRSAEAYRRLVRTLTELLALHPDYSLDEAFDRFCRDNDVVPPNKAEEMLAAACADASSFRTYEVAAAWQLPTAEAVVLEILRHVESGDRTDVSESEISRIGAANLSELKGKGFGAYRPALPRLRRECLRVLGDARETLARLCSL